MCGIVALFRRGGSRLPDDGDLGRMVDALRFRGPDAQTTFTRGDISLGHARLSIIDLESGTQPIFNETGELACILNGEIYNFAELTRELTAAGHVFKTRSDTESLVHLYEEHGPGGVSRTVGMFSYVIADLRQQRMVVFRDRMGEKPLYYVDTPRYFACASEIKALQALPDFDGTIDQEALAEYLHFGWISGTRSIYRSVRKLPPGSFMTIDATGTHVSRYWAPTVKHRTQPFNRAACVQELRELLRETVPGKLVADVPTGVLLSGGLDSAAVTAFAQAGASGTLRTFSAGFASQINELPAALQVARHFSTRHSELVVAENLIEDLLRVANYLDEPFTDSSCVPTYAIARAAREHVKVVLTGDGGDELFAGYGGYLFQRRHSDSWLIRKPMGAVDKVHRRLGWKNADPVHACYPLPASSGARARWIDMRSEFDPETAATLLGQPVTLVPEVERTPGWPTDPLAEAMEFDINRYLPDNLLKKVDMMSMLCSLEARAPLLDHRLIEYALQIPARENLRGGVTKSLFREVLGPLLPAGIVNAPKQGFGAPLVAWLKGPLRSFVLDRFAGRAHIDSMLDGALARRFIERDMANLENDWRAPGRIWTLLMLDLWAGRRAR